MQLFNGGGFTIVMFGLMGGVMALSAWHAKKRREQWTAWAAARQWRIIDRSTDYFSGLRGGPFGRGSSRSAKLIVEGRFNGQPVSSFSYQYSTGSGKNRSTYHFQICTMRVPGAQFPLTELAPEHWASLAFGEDLQFEDSEFNDAWRITSDSPRFAHAVVHPRMMEWLKRGFPMDISTLWLESGSVWVARRSHLDPDALDSYFNLLSDFVDHMPHYLFDDLGVAKPSVEPVGYAPYASVRVQRRGAA